MTLVRNDKNKSTRKNLWYGIAVSGVVVLSLFVAPTQAQAKTTDFEYDSKNEIEMPPALSELQEIKQDSTFSSGEDKEDLPFNVRKDAIKEAALSYGARGGLAWRTYHIRKELEQNKGYMNSVFNFEQLLISAPSGLLIEPPIISEAENMLIIEGAGQEAAVADRVYNINVNAKIVSAPRHWRNYLERTWGEVTPPPDLLRPENEEERELWIEYVNKGWEKGVEQADLIFETDVNQLLADYRGMVRYRMLLSQNMISEPFTLQTDKGVTGGGDNLRIGDRSVRITDKPQLNAKGSLWQPASR